VHIKADWYLSNPKKFKTWAALDNSFDLPFLGFSESSEGRASQQSMSDQIAVLLTYADVSHSGG